MFEGLLANVCDAFGRGITFLEPPVRCFRLFVS